VAKNTILLFLVFLGLTLVIREIVKRIPREVDYEALRDIEAGFFHDTRKKLRLITSTLRSMKEAHGEDLERLYGYVREDLKSLVSIFEESRLALERANLRRFRINEYEKSLKKLVNNVNLDDIDTLNSQIEKLRLELFSYQEPFDEVLERVVRKFKSNFKRELEGVNFKVIRENGIPQKYIWRDYGMRFVTIIYNFLTNSLEAVRSSEKREISMEITRDSCDPLFSFAIIIKDTGCGMDENTLKRFTYKGFTSGKSHGSGLGVTEECIEFIKRMGDFQVESELGVGTTIRICIS
jgi:signal transduction histidine kinase